MTLRTRLLLGYATLVLLLFLAAGGGALGFREVSVAARERLEHFVETTDAAGSLLRALDAHREAALDLVLTHDDRPDGGAVRARRAAVASALERAVEAELLPPEPGPIDAYLEATAVWLKSAAGSDPAGYLREHAASFADARSAAERLVSENQGQLAEASHAVARAASRNAALLGALATVGLITLVILAHGLRANVLDRLEVLRHFAGAVEAGRENQRLALDGRDELSRLGRSVNRMLDAREEAENRLRGGLAHQRELVLALLARAAPGSVLLGPAGELVAASDPEPEIDVIDGLAEEVRSRRVAANDAGRWTADDGTSFGLDRLDRNGRCVGWLAEPAAPPSDDTPGEA